jgi:hypothetical protein
MKLNQTAQRMLIASFFAIVAVVYAVAWLAPSIGLFHDDAVYLVTAKALVAGHGYTLENLPNPIPQTKYPPLFPLLVALFLMISDQAELLKLLPLICTAAWLLLTYKLLRKMGAEPWGSLLLVGLTAASPLVVFLGTNLLSEPLFALLLTAALLALLDDRMFLAGALAALASLTRTAGLPLIAAIALTLILRARFRRAIVFTATAVGLATPWFAWAFVHAAGDPYYGGGNYAASNMLKALSASEKASVIGANLMFLFSGPFTLLSGIRDVYAAIVTFCLLVWCLWKRRQLVPDLFLLLYCGMLLLWPGPPARFLVPVLPLILWLFWRVFRNIPIREALAAVVLIVALLPLWASTRRIPATFRSGEFPNSDRQPDDWKEMSKLFAWIRKNTPADAILAANLDPLFYLNTGRKAVRGYLPDGYKTFYQSGGQTVTPDQLSSALLRGGVSYVALTPDRDFEESAAFHKSVEALERGGILEPVAIPGLAPEYRLLRTASGRLNGEGQGGNK